MVKSYCGHGTGVLFHTQPNVPHYAKNKAKGTMQPGHVFTIEPMINLVCLRLCLCHYITMVSSTNASPSTNTPHYFPNPNPVTYNTGRGGRYYVAGQLDCPHGRRQTIGTVRAHHGGDDDGRGASHCATRRARGSDGLG